MIQILRRVFFGMLLICITCVLNIQLASGQKNGWLVERGAVPSRPKQAGFTMTYSTPNLAANGYMPVQLDFYSRTKTFPADRTISVRLSPRTEYTTDLDFEFWYDCILPQGSSRATFTTYVPYYIPWNELSVGIFEEGRFIEDGSATATFDELKSRYADQHVSVGIFVPQPRSPQNVVRLPDVRSMVTVFGEGPIPEDLVDRKQATEVSSDSPLNVQPGWVQFRILSASPENAYVSWLGYSQLDMIMAKAGELEPILAEQMACTALTDWIAAGGTLLVYDGADVLFSKLGLTPSAVRQSDVPTPKDVRQRLALSEPNDTSQLLFEHYGDVYKESRDWQWTNNGKTLRQRSVVFDELVASKHPIVAVESQQAMASRIRQANLGLGSLTVIDDPDPFPGSFQFWQTIKGLHKEDHLHWTERNGIDVRKGNDHYWAWLIDAVGGPPVKSFFLINSLFVIVIGPVGYLFFRNRERLYLLLFAAPALALLLTIGLFLFALLADGWQTRVRARQITWQDAEAGYLVDHGRQTYFSSLGSSDGIVVPATTASYPVHYDSIEQYYGLRHSRSQRRISANDQRQQFSGQFLPSRTQVQYLMLRPRKRMPLVTFEQRSTKLSVTNHSDQTLTCVVANDGSQKRWFARSVQAGESAEMSEYTGASIRELLDVAPLDYPLLVPDLTRKWPRYSTGAEISLSERKLNDWLRNLPSSAFIATTELQRDLIGVPDPNVAGSLRVIMGAIP